jgi:enoyl-CoA hydratase/carnithine racemase
MNDFVTIAVADGIQTIRIDRPEKKNALTSAMYAALAEALGEARTSDQIRVSVILGAPGAFCAGNDIADFLQLAQGGDRGSRAVFDFLEQIVMAGKPLVAGVDGLAIGIGMTMLLHCDHVLASERSQFRTPFVDLGLIPEAGSTLLAPRLVGHHRSFALLALGETLSADQAREAGFVNRVTEVAALEQQTVAVARSIAGKPAEAMAITHRLIRGDRSDILARMREEARLLEERLRSAEARAAFTAFLDKSAGKQA